MSGMSDVKIEKGNIEEVLDNIGKVCADHPLLAELEEEDSVSGSLSFTGYV